MHISDFNYYKPQSIKEACQILAQSSDGAPLAGGTDLLVEIKQGLRHHQDIVSLNSIEKLKNINIDKNNLYIGAGATHTMVAESPNIKEIHPTIAKAALKIGTDQIRNSGTIGGNLCTGASCCDMAPILIALNANVEIVNSNRKRIVPLNDFFIFHKKTRIKKGEIMTKIIIPRSSSKSGTSYKKFGMREAASISVASVAAMIEMNNKICTDACIVIGAVAPIPKVSEHANKIINGKKLSELLEQSSILKQAGDAAAKDSIPIDDIRGSAEYRRSLIKVLVQRAINEAITGGKN